MMEQTYIGKIRNYIKRTPITRQDNLRYALEFYEGAALIELAEKDLLGAVLLAFEYGRAKGTRRTQAQMRKGRTA